MPGCAVPVCRYHTGRGREERKQNVLLHSLPSCSSLADIWWQRIRRLACKDSVKDKRVCSLHFKDEDYERDLKWELLNPGKSLMLNPRRTLKITAVPSLNLEENASGSEKGGADDDADSDDPDEWRNQRRRPKRRQRKRRKELVGQLLAEHEEERRLEREKSRAAEQSGTRMAVTQLMNSSDDAENGARPSDARSLGNTAVTIPAPTANAPAPVTIKATLAGRTRMHFHAYETTDRTATPAASTPAPAGKTLMNSHGYSMVTASANAPASATRTHMDSHNCDSPHPEMAKPPGLMVGRAKELLRLKMMVRKLEDRCLRELTAPSPNTGAPVDSERQAAVEGKDGPAVGADGPPAAAAETPPLMVLRDEHGVGKLPTIVTELRENQLSDDMAMPSGLQEAQEVVHRLRVQFLTLQAIMLKWAIKNKVSDSTLNKPKRTEGRRQKTVSSSRLRQLLHLETAIKTVFSRAQIRAITSEHGDCTDGDPPAKQKAGSPHWSDDDLRRVLELRAISSDKVVDHVREKLKIPLPTMQTTRKRCYKSPELHEIYKKALHASEERLCVMCEGQLNAIDSAMEAVGQAPSAEDDTPFGRQFRQLVPPRGLREEQPTVQGPRPRKRRRRAKVAASPVAGKRADPSAVSQTHDRPQTSLDSDADMPYLAEYVGQGGAGTSRRAVRRAAGLERPAAVLPGLQPSRHSSPLGQQPSRQSPALSARSDSSAGAGGDVEKSVAAVLSGVQRQ